MDKKIILSASSLNLFLDCPRCFWLDKNRGLKRPRAPFPSIATGLDSVVKKYFDTYRGTGELPPILKEEIKGRLIDILPKTFWYNADDINASLQGKLDDCIVDEDGFYIALDHKTRASSPSCVHEAFQFQLDVYTLLLKENNLKINNQAILVYYIPQAGILHDGFPFRAEVKKTETNPQRARKVFEEAVSLLRHNEPSSSSKCQYCNWVKELNAINR